MKVKMGWPNFDLEFVATYERAKRLMPIVLKEAMEAEAECEELRKKMSPNDKLRDAGESGVEQL